MKQIVVCLFLALVLQGCITLIPQRETRYETSSVAIKDIELAQDVNCELPTGQKHVLAKGSRWQPYGRTLEGTVYKPTNHTLKIADVEEYTAYLVISGAELLGFFLPDNRSFAPLSHTQQIVLK